MIFRRGKRHVKESVHGMDKLITGIIITGAAASIFGLSRTQKGKQIGEKSYFFGKKVTKKGVSLFGKTLVKILTLFDKK